MRKYIPPKITPLEQVCIFREFNKIRKINNLPELNESEMLLYLQRYFKNEWGILRDKIKKNNAKSVIFKEKKIIIRRNAKKQKYITQLEKYKEIMLIQESINHKRDIEDIQVSSKTKIKEGFIYFITNSAFPGWVKIGSTINLSERLSTYQTCDPNRKYIIQFSKYFPDCKTAEFQLHNLLNVHQGNGEWFKINVKKAIKIIESLK